MANVLVDESALQNIANSIRSKLGGSDTYKPSEMADAIDSISASSPWTDVTPDLSSVTITNGSGTAHSYDSLTGALRVYTTSNGTYREAHIPFTPENGAKYRLEYTLSNATTLATAVAFVNSTNDKIIYGYTRPNSSSYAYEFVASDQGNFSTSCQIRFYCTYSTSGAGDATWTNFKVYKYTGS